MAPFDQEVEDRMVAAMEAIATREGLSIRSAATEFNVKYSTLQRRLQGTQSVKNNGGHNKSLNAEQMKALCAFLDRQISLGNPTTKEMIEGAAKRILLLAGSQHELGKRWYTKWIKEHPKYHVPTRMGVSSLGIAFI